MRVTIPIETPVYYRRSKREKFRLRHLCRGGYVRHLPLTLTVGDLASHKKAEEQRKESAREPLLVLLTGKNATIWTFSNWDSPKQEVCLRPLEFANGYQPSADAETEPDQFFIRSFTHLATFSSRGCKHTVKSAMCIEAAGMVIFLYNFRRTVDQWVLIRNVFWTQQAWCCLGGWLRRTWGGSSTVSGTCSTRPGRALHG